MASSSVSASADSSFGAELGALPTARDWRGSGAAAALPALSQAMFAASYPEGAHKLRHNLDTHPLFEFEALAKLAGALSTDAVRCHRSDLAFGDASQPELHGPTIDERIRGIHDANITATLTGIEGVPAYAELLGDLVAEIETEIVAKTGRMLSTRSAIVLASPGSVTPCHYTTEHKLLLQIAGEGAMNVLPAASMLGAADFAHDPCQRDGGPARSWRDDITERGVTFRLEAGEAVYVPVSAPHDFRQSSMPSVALSISWRSEWSVAEADARACNGFLRSWGLDPQPPGRWPARNRGKAIAWRTLRRLPGIRGGPPPSVD